MTVRRLVIESPVEQGIDEAITYTLTTTPWGSSPAAVTVVAKDITQAYLDVSATVLSGAAAVLNDVITLPVLSALTVDHQYRIEVKFNAGGQTWEAYCIVVATR